MDNTKLLTLSIISILSIAISLTVTQVFLRKQKIKSEQNNKINTSYALSFATWVIAFSLLNIKSISILSDYIDIINKINTENALMQISKTAVVFLGLTNVWLIILYYFNKIFTIIFIGKRNEIFEIQNNNLGYFILKGILFLSFIFSLIPVFEILLRTFSPNETPFYH